MISIFVMSSVPSAGNDTHIEVVLQRPDQCGDNVHYTDSNITFDKV
jgi:hypothetical protein